MQREAKRDFSELTELEGFDAVGTAYISEISPEKVQEMIELDEELAGDQTLWALFSEDGVPIMLANERQELEYLYLHRLSQVHL